MNSSLTTLDPVTTASNAKTLLAREGFNCSLLTLAPGDEIPRAGTAQVEEHVLFVVEGEITVRFDDVNTILGKDQALLIPKGKEHALAAPPAGWAKILRVIVTPRQVVTPQILSFDSRGN